MFLFCGMLLSIGMLLFFSRTILSGAALLCYPTFSPSHPSLHFSPPPLPSPSPFPQCVSLRDTLLQDPNPYRHLNFRNLPPLDAELLVSMAFSLIPHLPEDMMDEIAQHPFLEEPIQADSA